MENSKAVAIEDADDFDKDVYQNSLSITRNFKWFGDFDNLQGLFNNLLNKQTSWSKPGGCCRKLEADNLTVRWYSENHSLTINGDKEYEIRSCLQNLAKEASDQDESLSHICVENKYDTMSEVVPTAPVNLGTSPSDPSKEITQVDLTKVWEKIESIEETLEYKIKDVVVEICKLKDAKNSQRDHTCFIEEENTRLKAENALKLKLDHTTYVMSDLNTKLKLIEEEKQSLVTALKILQNN